MKAVILAGGKGTRLSSVTNDIIPKSLVRINNIPILEYQIESLIKYNIKEIFIITGFLHNKIEEYFGDGSKWGVSIFYIIEETPRGTGGSLSVLKDKILDDFILLYGDLLFDISLKRMFEAHKKNKSIVTLLVHPSSHPLDSDVIIIDKKNYIVDFIKKNEKRDQYYRNLVNAGIYIIKPEIFKFIPVAEKMDLEKDIIFPLGKKKKIFAYLSSEYVKDIGTPERLSAGENDINNGLVKNKNIDYLQKCIFLDRDGTINKYKDYIYDADQLELEDNAVEAIKLINKSLFLAIVITNQPVVARGLCSEDDVVYIHNKLETLMGVRGAFFDLIKYCPHHPDAGFVGENIIYKVKCDCRKPDIGMINECASRYNISLKESFIIGDSTVDIQTGKNAGLKTILVQTGQAGKDKKFKVDPDYIRTDIYDAVNVILNLKG